MTFRLVVVLIVVSVVGFFWVNRSCACTYRESAMMAGVRGDLRNLAGAQESYFAEHESYAPSLDALDFSPSTRVTLALLAASDSGWSAVGIHRSVSGWCAMFVGAADPPIPDAVEGELACRWSAQGHERGRGLLEEK